MPAPLEGPDRSSCKARWLFVSPTEVLENAVLEIESGVITDIHHVPHPATIELGECCLLPAFVNAHAHLEFSDLKSPFQPPAPFSTWVRQVLKYRQEREHHAPDLIAGGLLELEQTGTAAVGEILTSDVLPLDYRDSLVSSIVFRELIELNPDKNEAQLQLARKHLELFSASVGHSETQTTSLIPEVLPGLSPHAPYTVNYELFKRIVKLAVQYRAPLAFHLAETRDELELLKNQTGYFRELLEERQLWRDDLFLPGGRPLDYLELLSVTQRALIIHGNYLNQEELEYLAAHPNLTLVYCPRTHHFFQHEPHPWQQLLDMGGELALGTDGRSSNPDLSMFDELRFMKQHYPYMTDEQLLTLGTTAGAKALEMPNLGKIGIGLPANFNVLRRKTPQDSLFGNKSQICGTVLRGNWTRRIPGQNP